MKDQFKEKTKFIDNNECLVRDKVFTGFSYNNFTKAKIK